jgi:hypothetical protein
MARSQQPSGDQERIVTVEEDHTDELLRALDALTRAEILVGIPSDDDQPHYDESGARGEGTVQRSGSTGIQSNASLGYIHEHGSPVNNIHARPWLAPGVEESRDQWLRYMQQAGEAVLTFPYDQLKMDKGLHAAGMTAVSSVKNRIVGGLDPPLSPRTIAARRRRTPSRTATEQADVTPLVDTAQMLNSISYVIKKE